MNKKKEVFSPCVSVCSIEEDTGFCRGCYRTLEEIARWKSFNDENREKTLAELDKRRALHDNSSDHPYST